MEGKLMRSLISKMRSKLGQGTVEYALITVAVVTIIVLAVSGTLQEAITAAFVKVAAAINP